MADEVTNPLPPAQTVEVWHASDVAAARRAAERAGEAMGFPPTACAEIALAVSELATNLVKHAQGGIVKLTPLNRNGQMGLQMESVDQGVGIADFAQALTDGFSTAGSLGHGLGTINRLTDEFDIAVPPGGGTHVTCRKWRRDYAASLWSCPLTVGVSSRPHPQCEVNGDAFLIKHWAESLLVGVIDGLGHGLAAHRAAQAARRYVEHHFDLPLADLFRGVERTCHGTRGVVMALCRFDWARATMTYASVGNIEARVCGGPALAHPFVRRGVLGSHAPAPLVAETPWQPDAVFVLHSDGVRSHWRWEDFPELAGKSAAGTAHALLQALAKETDDATVLVVRRGGA